jgi:hypothetical protein
MLPLAEVQLQGVRGIAIDSSGVAYLVGFGSGLPIASSSAIQTSTGGGIVVYVAVIDPSKSGASSLLYATYLGSGGTAIGSAITVDSFGAIYITGYFGSQGGSFPTTPGAYQSVFYGGPCQGGPQGPCPAAFIAKLNPKVSGPQGLVYSTYLGGTLTTVGTGIAVDSSGNTYVTGSTGGAGGNVVVNPVLFPTTPDAYQPCTDIGSLDSYAFIAKLNAGGSGLVYSTCLGGEEGGVDSVVLHSRARMASPWMRMETRM